MPNLPYYAMISNRMLPYCPGWYAAALQLCWMYQTAFRCMLQEFVVAPSPRPQRRLLVPAAASAAAVVALRCALNDTKYDSASAFAYTAEWIMMSSA